MIQKCDSEITPYLPHIISSRMPTTLLRTCRQIEENRLNNLNFTVTFRRTHQMQWFDNSTERKCICNKTIDKYGDYFFHCTRHSKIGFHNHIRNAIHFITSATGEHANFISNKEQCDIEQANLLPSFPHIRPGDITIHVDEQKSTTLTN